MIQAEAVNELKAHVVHFIDYPTLRTHAVRRLDTHTQHTHTPFSWVHEQADACKDTLILVLQAPISSKINETLVVVCIWGARAPEHSKTWSSRSTTHAHKQKHMIWQLRSLAAGTGCASTSSSTQRGQLWESNLPVPSQTGQHSVHCSSSNHGDQMALPTRMRGKMALLHRCKQDFRFEKRGRKMNMERRIEEESRRRKTGELTEIEENELFEYNVSIDLSMVFWNDFNKHISSKTLVFCFNCMS